MESIDVLRKRLIYQSHHRGMREMDFLLGRFADTHTPSMTHGQLKEFEALLAVPDQELYGLFFEKAPLPEGPLSSLVSAIQPEIKSE